MNDRDEGGPPRWLLVALTALGLSIGWGIRGNFGHEYGAMIAGALAAMAVALMSGREDWRRRVHYFGMLGALGWSFGGSISYMQVVAYTHSGHAPSVLYGFACLTLIGFLWAAPGGAGTALAAYLDRDRLTGLFAPASAVFLAWAAQELAFDPWLRARGFDANWYDTDWMGVSWAIAGVLALAAIRQRLDEGSRLILWMGLGWWAGFALLVLGLGLRMTPPRGDNWAGMVGLVAGLFAFLARAGLGGVLLASLVTGVLGGIGYAGATMLKLVAVTSGLETNWHSVMEQAWGLFFGLGLAAAMLPAVRRGPRLDDPPTRRWTEVYAAGFVLLGITYLNLRKNPMNWARDGTMPAELWGLPTGLWYGLAYLLLALAILVPMARHLRRPVAAIPVTWAGKGQLLFVAFLWWIVVGNFERAIVGFAGQRLVTEGVIQINAALATLLALLVEPAGAWVEPEPVPPGRIRKAAVVGLAAVLAAVAVDWGIVRAIYGDRFAGHASLHVRFGPGSTVSSGPR